MSGALPPVPVMRKDWAPLIAVAAAAMMSSADFASIPFEVGVEETLWGLACVQPASSVTDATKGMSNIFTRMSGLPDIGTYGAQCCGRAQLPRRQETDGVPDVAKPLATLWPTPLRGHDGAWPPPSPR